MNKELIIIVCRKVLIISGSILFIYSLTLLFTDYSLIGFWSDIIFLFILLLIFTLCSYKTRAGNPELLFTIRLFSLLTLISVIVYYSYVYINPWDIRKDTKSLKSLTVNNRRFHPYFQPVGSWGRGYGIFWITESPKFLPFIEKTVFIENGTDYDFNASDFDGTPTDEIVKNYILENILISK